ncbi:hypothetical protein Tco_0032952 [Tanacetum coccineum]
MLNLRVERLLVRKDSMVINLVRMVGRASAQCRKTCSVVRLSSQRSRFGYGDNTNKLLRELQEDEMGLDDQKWVMKGDELSLELIEDEEVPLVEGVLDGALGAFGEWGCCFGDGVLVSSSVRLMDNFLGRISVIFGFLESLEVEA